MYVEKSIFLGSLIQVKMELKVNRNTDRSLKRNGRNVTEGENEKRELSGKFKGVIDRAM